MSKAVVLMIDGVGLDLGVGHYPHVGVHAKTWDEFDQLVADLRALPGGDDLTAKGGGGGYWVSRRFAHKDDPAEVSTSVTVYAPMPEGARTMIPDEALVALKERVGVTS
jgi:hypothetical protein